MSSPKDAAIATIAELNTLTGEHGVYSIAENATSNEWINEKRQNVMTAIAKTKNELRRLEGSLQRLESLVTTMGKDGSTNKIEREYIPLEGWALTFVDNYATLLASLSRYDRNQLCDRLAQYTRGAIIQAKGGNASHSMGRVRDFLKDRSIFY